MRLRAVLAALTGVVSLALLAACSSSGDGTTTTGTSSVSPAATYGPAVPPATAIAAPVPADQLPTATGAFGEKPTLTFPSTPPPPSLQRVILAEGTGPLTEAGDWLITNYLGQKWGGDVFDNSYDRGAPSPFQIGVGAVVPGWDVGLVGVPVGSRVLLSLPPADGYGADGQLRASMSRVTTPWCSSSTSSMRSVRTPAARPTRSRNPPRRRARRSRGAPGAAPTITVPPGTPEPTAPSITVLAQGTGAPIQAGQVLVQYTAVSFAGEPSGNTWPTPGDPRDDARAGSRAAPGRGRQPVRRSRRRPRGQPGADPDSRPDRPADRAGGLRPSRP